MRFAAIFSVLALLTLTSALPALIRTPDYEIIDGEDGFGLVQEIPDQPLPEAVETSNVHSIVASKPLAALNRKIDLLAARIAFTDKTLRIRTAITKDITSLKQDHPESRKDFLGVYEERLRASYLVSRSTTNVDASYKIFEAQMPLDKALKIAREHMTQIERFRELDELTWKEFALGLRFETDVNAVEGMNKHRDLLVKEEKVISVLGKKLDAAVMEGLKSGGLDKSLVGYILGLRMGA